MGPLNVADRVVVLHGPEAGVTGIVVGIEVNFVRWLDILTDNDKLVMWVPAAFVRRELDLYCRTVDGNPIVVV